MGVLNVVKAHPFAVGAGVVVLIGGFVLLNSGGSSASDSTASDYASVSQAAVEAGLQLQAMQNQQSLQSQGINASLTATQDTNATQVQLAQLAAAVQSQNITAQQSSTDLANTLQAQLQTSLGDMAKQVSLAQIASQNAIVDSNNQTALAIQQSNNAVLNKQISTSAALQEYQMQTFQQINATNQNTAAYMAALARH